MPIINTADLQPTQGGKQIYNGLDACVTVEVLEELQKLVNRPPDMYNYELGLQAPILDVMLRGFRVNEYQRQATLQLFRSRRDRLQTILNRLASSVWGRPLNPRSHPQMRDFFYSAMGLPEIWITDKGQKKLSFKREILEKLEMYFYAMPVIATILALRDILKLIEILETEVDPDGRMRTSYNIGGTETWRLSSSASAWETGGNLQNWPPELRQVFVSDKGWKICVIDLEQAESREVGWKCGLLFDDWTYLDLCESTDLHTMVCKMLWPDLPWSGDPVADKHFANTTPFYRDYPYRDATKKLGHATNYFGTAWGLSRRLHILLALVENFQVMYFDRFPAIPKWHRWTAAEIQTNMKLELPFGAVRHFFGRPGDEATLREAIACQGQTPTALRTNTGLYRIWKEMPQVQCLAQTHDSVTFQYQEKNEADDVPQALKLMEVWQQAPNGRKFVVPGEAKIGWNWNNRHDTSRPVGPKNKRNDDGLIKYKGPGLDKRVRTSLMEHVL